METIPQRRYDRVNRGKKMLINEMVLFYYVVELSSFSKAAEKFGVSKAFISKHINKLENDLKCRLLNRSTRQLSLTEAGEIFFQHCQSLSELATEAYESIHQLQKKPSGLLKIAAPSAFAAHVLPEVLIEFKKHYPDIRFNIICESTIVDIVKHGYDLAIRSAYLPDSTLIGQKIASLSNILCASPDYLKKHPAIKKLDQLSQYPFALYSSCKPMHELHFTKKNEQQAISINTHFQSNNLDLTAQLILGGACLGVLPEFMIKEALKQKRLVHCLSEYKLPDSPLYVVYPERKLKPLKVKVFIDLLKKYLK